MANRSLGLVVSGGEKRRDSVYTQINAKLSYIKRLNLTSDLVLQCKKPRRRIFLLHQFVLFQRAEAAQREAEALREQLSLSNQSQQLSSPARADPDTVTRFIDSLDC